MMVSPNYYYEEHLKGKSKEEIAIAIEDLKSEMERLIGLKESGAMTSEALMQPSPEVRVKACRNYLEEAIRALAEAGGNYQPTPKEILSENFNQQLKFLKRIVYMRNGFDFGNMKYTFDINKNSVKVETEMVPNGKEAIKKAYEIDKEYLMEQILATHVGEWKSEYFNCNILDGESWELEFIFSGKYKKKQFWGSNAWPWNWYDLIDAMQMDASCNM